MCLSIHSSYRIALIFHGSKFSQFSRIRCHSWIYFNKNIWHFAPSPGSTAYSRNCFSEIGKNSNLQKFRRAKRKRYTVLHMYVHLKHAIGTSRYIHFYVDTCVHYHSNNTLSRSIITGIWIFTEAHALYIMLGVMISLLVLSLLLLPSVSSISSAHSPTHGEDE